jgi:hypothetical protein
MDPIQLEEAVAAHQQSLLRCAEEARWARAASPRRGARHRLASLLRAFAGWLDAPAVRAGHAAHHRADWAGAR